MHFKILVLFALVSVVRNHDVYFGAGGKKIFEDTRFASPAIWRQVENVTVIAPSNEVISKVNITDMRADKDGDVNIVNGGEGKKSVTIEIKSPTVLRGYEFHIEVFSVPESDFKKYDNSDKTEDAPEIMLNNDAESSETEKDIPTSVAKDSDVMRPARQTNDEKDSPQLPEENETETETTDTETAETETTETEESTTTETYASTIDTEEYDDRTTESGEGSGDQTSEENENAITAETSNEDEDIEHQDLTSELPEFVTTDDDVVRPARETNDENELTVTTAENLNKDATENSLNGDDTMNTPNTYFNGKDIPIDSSLSILDYIKSKEQGNRQIRRTEDKTDTSDEQSSSEEQSDENESSTTESTKPTNESDDTVDLVPPEVDAPYNTDFSSDLENTTGPIESSSSFTNSRKPRRWELPDEYYAITENSTPIHEDATTESSLEEKSRNSRNTEDNLTNETGESNLVATNNVSSGIVIIKEDRVIVSADGKQVQFTLPIVLVIGNENNFPIFQIIEDTSVNENKDVDESETSLTISPDTSNDYEVNDFVKSDEYSY